MRYTKWPLQNSDLADCAKETARRRTCAGLSLWVIAITNRTDASVPTDRSRRCCTERCNRHSSCC